jgi:hypothetical protein
MSVGKRSAAEVNRNRKRIYSRDGQCVVQGTDVSFKFPCSGEITIQHRVTRGMGSSNLFDEPNGLIAFCYEHNTLEPRSSEFRAICEKYGWSVKRGYATRVGLSFIPVMYDDGWCLLEGFSRRRISDEEAESFWRIVYFD